MSYVQKNNKKKHGSDSNVKCRVNIWFGNSTPRHIPKRNENTCSQKDLEYTQMFRVVVFKIVQK